MLPKCEEQGLVRMYVYKSSVKRLLVKAESSLPLLQEAVIHKFNNKGHKAEGKNKRRKSKVL